MSSSSRTTYETDYETVTKRVRRGLGGWWWLALLAIPLLLAAAAAFITRGGIEDDLKADATKALDKAGITNAKVDFDGRDGTVTLPGGADKDVAKKAVEGVDGVRAAEIKGGGVAAPAPTTPAETPTPSETASATETPSPSATAAAETGPFSVTTKGDEVIVEGVVPDEATKTAVIDAAKAGAAGKTVTDKVTVTAGSPKVDPAQVTGALGVLTAAGADGNKVAYDGKGGVTLTGEVADEAAKTKQGTEATTKFPSATVTNNLTYKAAGADCATLNATIAGFLKGNNPTFADNSTTLLAASHPTLDKVAAALKACPDAKVAVSGHTDNTGNAPRNLRLSQGRATAVRSYLASKGASANNITAKGFGQTKPIASNADAAGRDANRRVEITVGG